MIRSMRLALIGLALAAITAQAQDSNYLFPVGQLELLLRDGTFRITDFRGARAEGDRTQRVVLEFSDTVRFAAQLEITGVAGRLRNLIQDVDRGRRRVF